MTFSVSPGTYSVETDQSFIVGATANSIGAIVIDADRGPSDERVLITSNKQFIDTFGKPSPNNPSMYSALSFLAEANRLYVVRVINNAVASSSIVLDAAVGETFTFTANGEGAWGNNLTIDVSATVDSKFTVTIYESAVQVESFIVSKSELVLDGYGRSLYIEDVINAQSQYVTVVDNVANTNAPAAIVGQAFTLGSDDTIAPTSSAINLGWDLFATKEEVEISLLINAGWADTVVQTKMITLAESRKDCIAILDIPDTSATVGDMVTYNNTTLNANTSYAAIYAGWIYMYDQYNDKYIYVAPSGYVAGVYAKTAQVSEVWYAPAGVRRGVLKALGVSKVFTEGERDTLYTANINPIQNFTGEGIQVYGQKTLQRQASALDRVNVRMLLITVEKAISRALRPFVFEFNDTFTRENITSIIDNYMGDIKVRRGVYDFATVCNESNNTPTVIDQNKMLVDLYVKPARVAEFIKLNVVITATGATLTVG
jgi:phage tail sheath protein FI